MSDKYIDYEGVLVIRPTEVIRDPNGIVLYIKLSPTRFMEISMEIARLQMELDQTEATLEAFVKLSGLSG